MNHKKIDFETLCQNCEHLYQYDSGDDVCGHHDVEGQYTCPSEKACPIWAGLEEITSRRER